MSRATTDKLKIVIDPRPETGETVPKDYDVYAEMKKAGWTDDPGPGS